jgi:signal transduction histidine kinase/ActR/RegA family two-component response regulator
MSSGGALDRVPVAHAVHFFEGEESLADEISGYLQEGLREGERVIVICTPERWDRFAARLEGLGFPVTCVLGSGQLVVKDAETMLAGLMVDGQPDRELFRRTIGGLFSSTDSVRAYGDMVSVLASRGDLHSAVTLEQFWSELVDESHLRLLCVYPQDHVRSGNDAVLRTICRLHDHVSVEGGPNATALYRAALDRVEQSRTAIQERFRLLTRASETLASTLDFDTTLRNVVNLTMPLVADFGFFDVMDGDDVRRISGAYRDPPREAILGLTRWKRWEHDEINVCALWSGRIGYHPSIDDEWYCRAALNSDHLAILRTLAFRSMVTVPMRVEDRVIGALTLFYADSGRRHTLDDVMLIEEVARRAAPAVENARLYRALQQEMRRREEADRRKDEFLAMLGHELRNPLAPVMTALQLMKLRGSNGDEREREVIERQVRHLRRLVDDLLDVSRITRGKIELRRERVEIAVAVAKAIEMARPLIEDRLHTLIVEVPDVGLPVDGDEIRLAQVFANLLTNAAKYSDRGGQIILRARRDGSHAVLECQDKGSGIPAHLLPRIFDLFSQGERTLDRSQGGLGLGLALARSLTEMHGGTVEASSAGPGHGSTFCIRLPLTSSLTSVPTVVTSVTTRAAATCARVLLVDDNRDAAEMMAEALRVCGFEVALAHDGECALAEAARMTIDAAVIDIGLPRIDGFAVARQLRNRRNAQRPMLIALTGYGQERDARDALEAGFDAHLVKPVTVERLVDAIHTAERRSKHTKVH